jgi:hypothetical protein
MQTHVRCRTRLVLGALTVATAFGSVACATSRGGSATTEGGSDPVVAAGSLTGTQVRQTSAENLYDALLELRPQWLRPRPRSSMRYREAAEPVVYLYGLRYGSSRTLYDIHVSTVRSVQYVSPLDATTRYGTDHSGGVILVDLDRR